MISRILALDPGQRTGYAVFDRTDYAWHLTFATVTSPNVTPGLPYADLVVIENPQRAYAGIPFKSILKLARTVGRYEERFKNSEIRLVEPREWKGSIDGDIMIRRIEAAMTPEERLVVAHCRGADRHNAIDAIGLGKWALTQPWVRLRKD